MATKAKNGSISKRNKWIIGIVATFVFLVVFVMVFGTPSAESVFKDMNEEMLKVKSVTMSQKYTMTSPDSGVASINSNIYMDMTSSKKLLAKGDFSFNITNSSTPMSISGDIIKEGDNNFVRFTALSSTSSAMSPTLSSTESMLKNNWVTIRDGDQYASIAKSPLDFTSEIMPTPYANLTDLQRKNVIEILQNKNMYTIDESTKVNTGGVDAYKYSVTYDKDQFKKAAEAIARYVSYFKFDSSKDSDIKTLTVWVNISTKQIIKIEFTGTSTSGNLVGSITFSGYNQVKSVEKPSKYYIESELLK